MATAQPEASAPVRVDRRRLARVALIRRGLVDSRVRTAAFGYLFAAVAYATVSGYASAYPTLPDRVALARAFGGNAAARLFFGKPYDLLTPGGFAAWRAAGLLSVFAAVAGSLAAVRALRTEEDTGRTDLVLSGSVSRGDVFGAAILAASATAAVLWLATFAGLVIGGLPAGGSAYLALATIAVTPVFVGIGALACQLAPRRRTASALCVGVVAAALVLRVLADTVGGLGWLRWATPLGWTEELRPFSAPHPAVLVLPIVSSVALTGTAGLIAQRRDVGTGLMPARETRPPRRYLLGNPTALAVRETGAGLLGWMAGSCLFGLIIGIVSSSISSAGISASVTRQLHKIVSASVTTPAGYIAFTYLLFAFAFSLFAASQVAATRREEAEQRLETLLSLPVSRRRWLAGRLLMTACAVALLAALTGALTWLGAASEHTHVSLASTLEAGGNTLPAALLFLGLGALAFALLPRASAGLAYGFVGLAFVWDLLGALIGAPSWSLGLSPFDHLAAVPVQSFRGLSAIVMSGLACLALLGAVELFARRDLCAG